VEVRRSRHGKTALVISGNAIVKILGITANGPRFDMVAFKQFYTEYNALSNMSVDAAIYSFIGVAKRAYKHDQEVCDFLWEQIMSKNLSEMTLSELVLVYNDLCKQVGKPPRKTFDSKAVALESIAKLDESVTKPTPIQVKAEIKSNRSKKMNEQVEGQEVSEKKPRGKGIGARAAELILEGKTNQEVIDTIKSEIEGANPTNATIAWYKNKLRQEGKLAKPVKKEKKVKAVAEVDAADEDEDMDEAA